MMNTDDLIYPESPSFNNFAQGEPSLSFAELLCNLEDAVNCISMATTRLEFCDSGFFRGTGFNDVINHLTRVLEIDLVRLKKMVERFTEEGA